MVFSKKDIETEAKGWFYDRCLAKEVEARRYLILSLVLSGLLALSLIGWIIMLPFKTTVMEPYVVLVDDVTGITSTLTKVSSTNFKDHAPVVKYFLNRYVRAREGYYHGADLSQKNIIKAFTSPEEYKHYESELNMNHEENNDKGRIKIDVFSVTFPFENIAHVRFTKQFENMNKSTWLATLQIDQMDEIDGNLAEINPLGLVVINYEAIKEGDYETIN